MDRKILINKIIAKLINFDIKFKDLDKDIKEFFKTAGISESDIKEIASSEKIISIKLKTKNFNLKHSLLSLLEQANGSLLTDNGEVIFAFKTTKEI